MTTDSGETATPGLRVSRHGPVVEMVIDNPARRNAMSLDMWRALASELEAAADRTADRVVVLRGAGETAFCAGNDVSEYREKRSTAEQIRVYNDIMAEATERLRSLEKPTIAAINGACIGGGLHLALLCDLRLCTDTATFAIPSARLGLPYRLEGVRTMLAVLPPPCLREMLLTGAKFDSTFAMRWGLVNRCVPGGVFDAAVTDLAAEIAAAAPLSHRCTKIALEQLLFAETPDLEAIRAAETTCYESDDYREGIASFREKRTPDFQGF